MRGTLMLIWILIICLSQVAVQCQYYSKSLPYHPKPVKVTNLHFFFHETLGSENPTAVVIAQANIPSNHNNSSVPFATLYALDDPLKIGPEHDSEVIGNAQGLAVLAGTNTTDAVMDVDFAFTTGKFKEIEREVAVIGGRGQFKMATGFALLKAYFINSTNVINEYNVTVIHY
ncbi:hypothetical protein ERO13_A10G232250v2 [Gossypium hirsutum]|nr:hypothetical protein ERO13_A10G232250v2 [Gossypium hirsutum]